MNRVILVFSVLLFCHTASVSQSKSNKKVIQVWKIAVTKEADVWSKKQEVNSLESARWTIRQDSVPSLQILGSPGIKRLITDKHAQIKVSMAGSGTPQMITRNHLLDGLMTQINTYLKQKKVKDQAALISGMEINMKKEAPVLYEEALWSGYMNNKSFDSVLSSYDKYVRFKMFQMKTNPADSLSQKNYPKDSVKFMAMAKRVRAAAEKSLLSVDQEQYEVIKNKNKIAGKQFPIPPITYDFDISQLVKPSTAWSPADVTVTLEKKTKPFMYITFDTLLTIIPDAMPIADSALCDTDLIGEDIRVAIDIKKYVPCGSAAGFPCSGSYTPSFWEKKAFSITFSKNGTQEIPGSLEPAHQYLKSNQLELKKVTINAFASIEGETEKNLALANERANVMVKVMKSYGKDSVDADINCAENWKDFYKDLSKTPFAQWKDMDTLKIKTLINDSTNAQILEPWLRNHRYANLEVFGQKRMTEKEKADKIKQQYDAYILSLKSAIEGRKPQWEQKVNGMRSWVVKEYLAGRMKKQDAEEYFKVMTPGLQIADFYLQNKVLASGKDFLGAGKEEWFLKTVKAALARREELIADMGTLTSEKVTQKTQTELQLDMNMDFLRQCLQVMIYSVRKGRISAAVYDSLALPQTEDFIPANMLIDYAKINNDVTVLNKPGGASIEFYDAKVPNSARYIKDHQLARCSGSIYCVDHPYYKDLRTSILKPKKMTEGNKELMKKVAYIFCEVQIAETDALSGKYYDPELDIFKVKEMSDKLQLKGICKIQKDKLSLESNKKAAIFRFYQDDKNARTTELDAICAYYIKQKAYMNPELVERVARMILWFDKENSPAKENLNKAQEFLRRMGVETDKRFRSLKPLMERINLLALKSTLVEK